MKAFEERTREVFKSHLRSNITAFAQTQDAIRLILSSRTLIGRLDASSVSHSLALVRADAWAALSVRLHEQLRSLHGDAIALLSTELAVPLISDLAHYLDGPILGATLPQWIRAAESTERVRAYEALRMAHARKVPLIHAFDEASPYARTNSSIAAITVTAATTVLNQATMNAAKQAGRRHYQLWIARDQRQPDLYKHQYEVGRGPVGPMFIGDRTIPVLG